MSKPFYIALDGGGTKSEAALFTSEGEILRQAHRGGCNPNVVGLDGSCAVITDILNELTAASPEPPQGIFAGIAGSLSGNRGVELEERLRPAFPQLVIESDIMNVIYAADAPGKCVAAIMGTGSSIFAYDGDKLYRAGGWGYLLDLAGGGFDIGREVIRACLARDDGFAAPSRLVELAEEQLGGRALDQLATFYQKGADYIASFAPTAFKAMREGDVTARGIIVASVRRVAGLVRFVRDRYDCGDRIVFSGGLLSERDILEPLLSEVLGDEIAIEFPSRSQLEGAIRRCLALHLGPRS